MTKTIAFISDIHGNSFALKEIIKDIERRQIKTIVNLGDSLYGPLDPQGTYEQLADLDVINVYGNQDQFILHNLDKKSSFPTLEYVKSQLSRNSISWLKRMTFDTILNEQVYCCHGSPRSDSSYLLESLSANQVLIKENIELQMVLGGINQDIIACGHSHVSRVVKANGKTIINPGSVGLAAYDDEEPIYHKMENYSPCSRYAVLKLTSSSVKVEQVCVKYNYEKAAKLAERNNRKDWAYWIRTGRA